MPSSVEGSAVLLTKFEVWLYSGPHAKFSCQDIMRNDTKQHGWLSKKTRQKYYDFCAYSNSS